MSATATDYDDIVRVVQLYVAGFNDCDASKFREAFHEDAWIFFTNAEGSLRKRLLRDVFDDWAAPPKKHIVGRIISVRQAGDIASVLLGFDNQDPAGDSWVDLHALIRVDGRWKITNKTATHATRAGGD
jgi:ketosteroid isomerase-like protein